MSLTVSVVVRSMPHRVANSLAVLVAKSDALAVAVRPVDSAKLGPVELVVRMPDCSGCKKEREKEGRSSRALTRLPNEVTQNPIFNRKALPIQLCVYCDGDALSEALKAHQKRIAKP